MRFGVFGSVADPIFVGWVWREAIIVVSMEFYGFLIFRPQPGTKAPELIDVFLGKSFRARHIPAAFMPIRVRPVVGVPIPGVGVIR